MAKYFTYFPKTYYKPIDEGTNLDVVTNIMTRFRIQENLKENAAVYYTYDISDGDTPEILAAKLYDSPEKHWMILFMNDIVDPQYDWPLSFGQLTKYIDEKYKPSANSTVDGTGVTWAKSNIHSYYKKIETVYQNNTKEEVIRIDQQTYANTASSSTPITLADGSGITKNVSRFSKTYYEYESDENEKKRRIKILKPELVYELDNEFRRIVNE